MLGRQYASHFLSGECTYSALVFPVRRACTPYTVIEISHSVFPTQNMYTFFHRHRESTIHLLSTARTPCTRSIKVHPIQDVSCQALRFKAFGGVRGGLSRKSSLSASPERSPERFPSVPAYPAGYSTVTVYMPAKASSSRAAKSSLASCASTFSGSGLVLGCFGVKTVQQSS